MTADRIDAGLQAQAASPRVAGRSDAAAPRRSAGAIAAIVGAALAIGGNAIVLGADPNVTSDVVSYPLSPSDFRLGQLYFALTQALMAAGIVALARSGVGGPARWARVAAYTAVAGFVITVPGELVLALVADVPTSSSRVDAASSLFGIGVLLADLGLIAYGVAAIRSRRWPLHWAAVPLALGAFQLLVVTPVVFAAGFASVAAFVVISVADALVALLGYALLRHPPAQ